MKEFGTVPLSAKTIADRQAYRDAQRSKTLPEVIKDVKNERKAKDKRFIATLASRIGRKSNNS